MAMESSASELAGEVAGLPDPSSLEYAELMYQSGRASIRSDRLDEAIEFLSRALEIRVSHFGELSPECAETYYRYGCAFLYKVQAEADPLSEPKSSEHTEKKPGSSADEKVEAEQNAAGEHEEEEGEDDGQNECEDEEEEESDLDYAWKMLDIARAILERQNEPSLLGVDVISALADVSLEREDFEMCFQDYSRALEILEGLVEPDNRRLAELCFKLSLAHQLGYKPKEALEYCNRAVSVCEARLQRLKGSYTDTKDKGKSIAENPSNDAGKQTVTGEHVEVKEIEGLLEELREKVVELEEMALGPSLLEVFKMANPAAVDTVKQVFSASAMIASSEANVADSKTVTTTTTTTATTTTSTMTSTTSNGFDAPALQTDACAPVVHLGVVGRGVKRVAPIPVSSNGVANQVKKRSLDALMSGGGAGETSVGFGNGKQEANGTSSSSPAKEELMGLSSAAKEELTCQVEELNH